MHPFNSMCPATHRSMTSAIASRGRQAFTLIEMVMVMVVMALLATVAVQMVEPRVDQARYEATVESLENVRESVFGEKSAVSAGRTLTGFVADCGRLPRSVEELMLAPDDLTPFANFSFDSDRSDPDPNRGFDVRLSGGWRGRYVGLPIGQTQMLDGWGRPISIDSTGSPAEWHVKSFGRDGDSLGSESGYDEDVVITVGEAEWKFGARLRIYEADPAGNLGDPDPTDTSMFDSALFPDGYEFVDAKLGILLFGACADPYDDSENGSVEEFTLEVPYPGKEVGTYPGRNLTSQTIDFEYSFEAEDGFSLDSDHENSMGEIAFRAIVWDDTNGDGQLDATGERVTKKSAVHYVTATGAATIRLDFVLTPVAQEPENSL